MGKKSSGSRYQKIVDDLTARGWNFRINDLNDGLEYSVSNEGWKLCSDVIEAVIRTDMREDGYGVSGTGKSGYGAMRDAYMTLAHKQRYNPIKEYFLALEGQYPPSKHPYVNELFCRFFTNPDGAFSNWLFRWMVGAIAKVFTGQRNPMLVLDGPQNMGKSWFVEWLSPLPAHFIRDSINPDDKDSHLLLSDMLLWEVEEADSTTRRADASALKAFITRDTVKKRPAYGRHRIEKPALCSFIGTINFDGSGFLVDTTGNTRFLICLITEIDFDYTITDKNLLWAEAYWYYKNTDKAWELTPEETLRRDQINEQYEVPSALENVINELYIITGDKADFVATSGIQNLVSQYYRFNSEQLFYRELARVMTKLGLIPGRSKFKSNDDHRRGWIGLKRRQEN
jgi:predicted P-loop ATPase